MMLNIGIDIEEVSRFKKKDITLLKKILSKDELRNIKKFNPMRIAGIFSAKEAIIKALIRYKINVFCFIHD